jgi:hypothetical protein
MMEEWTNQELYDWLSDCYGKPAKDFYGFWTKWNGDPWDGDPTVVMESGKYASTKPWSVGTEDIDMTATEAAHRLGARKSDLQN